MKGSRKEAVGHGRPPTSGQFQKGRSGNARGRPRGRRREIPYDHVLGQMVTIQEDGKQRRVTAAEAFMLQLTKKGLEGCSASARASLASIENARAARGGDIEEITILRIIFRTFGLCCVIDDLGMGVRLNASSKENVRLELKPWIVQAALDRMIPLQLSIEEQRVVIASTFMPEKVNWPDWWQA